MPLVLVLVFFIARILVLFWDFCREVWLLFCVGENGKRWDFSKFFGFCFWLCSFFICWLYGGWDFRVGDDRDQGEVMEGKSRS